MISSIKWENAFDQQIYPFGDWRDQWVSVSKSWSFSKVSIQSSKSKSENPKYLDQHRGDKMMKIFKIEKCKERTCLKYHPNSDKTTDLNESSYDMNNFRIENLFNDENSQKNSWRRDVIIKSILRYFQKFLKQLFQELVGCEVKSRTQLSYKGLNTFRQHITVSDLRRVLIKLNLITNMDSPNSNQNMQNEEMINFVSCLLNQKGDFQESSSHKAAKLNSESLILKRNAWYIEKLASLSSPSKIMNELLHRYSHYKLQKFFENNCL